MRRRPSKLNSEWTPVIVMVIAAIVLTVLHHRAGRPGGGPDASSISLPERAARWVLMPVQQGFTACWGQVSLSTSGPFQRRKLVEENRRLKEQLAEADGINKLRQYEHLDWLAMQSKFRGIRSVDEMRAKVIGRSGGPFMRQTIDIVAEAGGEISRGDIVRTARGLIGRVTSSGPRGARVTLLTDQNSGAFAVVSAAQYSTGAIIGPDPAGSDPDLLRLQKLAADAPISVGDKVFTSPLGDTYREGLFIGEIEEVVGRGGPSRPKTALVRPAADFSNLDYVIVMEWAP